MPVVLPSLPSRPLRAAQVGQANATQILCAAFLSPAPLPSSTL